MIWECKNCGRRWYYRVSKCIICRTELAPLSPTVLRVKGITAVNIPSPEHDRVPYYILLLEDENNNLHIKKSFRNYKIGERIDMTKEEYNNCDRNSLTIAIIGTGVMGTQLAEFLAKMGYSVILCGRSSSSINKAISIIKYNLSKMMDEQEQMKVLGRIETTLDLSRLKGVTWAIEAINEDIDLKNKLFEKLSMICTEETTICTNTSSIPITELALHLSRPERFIGMHFFNPVSKMNLVEIVYGDRTSCNTIERARKLAQELGKIPIIVRDSPGFIVNRLLMPFINEASTLLSEGVSAEDIDSAIKLGLNHPMGPLALADLIGLDVCVSIMNAIYVRTGDEKYKPSMKLNELVRNGHLGKKTGKGFYEYSQKLIHSSPELICVENGKP